MKAILDFDEDMGSEVNIKIENEEIPELMQLANHVNEKSLRIGKLPEHGNEIVISDNPFFLSFSLCPIHRIRRYSNYYTELFECLP